MKKSSVGGSGKTMFADGTDGANPKKGPSLVATGAPKNMFMDIVHSIMDKNRTRVFRYYCANPACPTTFFDASTGYACPACSSFGIISEFKNDTAHLDLQGRPVLGCLDSLGRLFCVSCALRHGVLEDVGMFVLADSIPYAFQSCEACRSRLCGTPHPET